MYVTKEIIYDYHMVLLLTCFPSETLEKSAKYLSIVAIRIRNIFLKIALHRVLTIN